MFTHPPHVIPAEVLVLKDELDVFCAALFLVNLTIDQLNYCKDKETDASHLCHDNLAMVLQTKRFSDMFWY